MPPPTVARALVTGSGPYMRPYWRTAAERWLLTMPGCTRAHRSSGDTSSTLRMYLEKSMTMVWFVVWPASAVPPPRGVTGTPCSRAMRIVASTSSAVRGTTTPTGVIWKMEASVEYMRRL